MSCSERVVVFYEKRKHARREITRLVQVLTVEDSRPPVTCTLLDVSKSGARLNAPGAADLPSEFLLLLGGEVQRWCRVVRRVSGDVGVKFIPARRADVALIDDA